MKVNPRLPVSRRTILRYGSLFVCSSLMPAFGAWAAQPQAAATDHRLIVLFLRGAVDGLNVVVPYREAAYYQARPTIAIPKPGSGADGAIELDGQFGLHPALADLLPLWQKGQLAFVHASGSPDPTRSHFDAQDYMESGTPGQKKVTDGWMNRLLAVLNAERLTEAVSFSNSTPKIFSGPMPVANLATGKAATQPLPIDRPALQAAFDRLYSGTDAVSKAYQQGRATRDILIADLQTEMEESGQGAPPSQSFALEAHNIARLMSGKSGTRLAFMALGNWDTHVQQGSTQGQLANRLQPLGQGLKVLVEALGADFQKTTIVVLSEFGRTVAENGNRGTDHGHGNVMWVLGGSLKGRNVYGTWPGLGVEQRYQKRDLAVTTDFRDVFAPILQQKLGLSDRQFSQVFPNHRVRTKLPLV